VIAVAATDRGGALAALYGTLALLSRDDQALVAGFVVNKFRGDARLLQPGLDRLHDLTGRPVLGVLPWTAGLWLDAEDSLSLGAGQGEGEAGGPPPAPMKAGGVLRVAVVRLPRISNFTDTDPLAAEPGVALRFVTSPAEIADADLVILPGSRATVADLAWLRERGLADAVTARAARGGPVLGICGGYQMLARRIRDDVESGAGLVPGLGLLPATVEFGIAKVLRLRQETSGGEAVAGYEIHHGVVTAQGGEPFPGGCAAGVVLGTTWHGIFESDGFRGALLRRVAAAAGRSFEPGNVTFTSLRERKLDALGDLIDAHLDTVALQDLIDHGAPAGLPFIPPGTT
jgi:adenosylcobyric acid synthase